MTTSMSKWVVPVFGFVLAVLIAVALMGRNAGPPQVLVGFAIAAGYAVVARAPVEIRRGEHSLGPASR